MQAPALGPSPPAAERAARTRQAASAFEAMAIGAMLKPMFETLDASGGPFGGGAGEAAWRPMLIEAIGTRMAQRGGIGLADAIVRALMQGQETGARTAR